MSWRFFPSTGGAGAGSTALPVSYGAGEARTGACPSPGGWGMGEVGAWLCIDGATKKCARFLRRRLAQRLSYASLGDDQSPTSAL